MDPANGAIHKKKVTDFIKDWTGVIILLLPDEAFTTGNQRYPITQGFGN